MEIKNETKKKKKIFVGTIVSFTIIYISNWKKCLCGFPPTDTGVF